MIGRIADGISVVNFGQPRKGATMTRQICVNAGINNLARTRFGTAFFSLFASVLLGACATLPGTSIVRNAGTDIAYSLAGAGSQTVVLQSGLGDGKQAWTNVFAKLSASRAVFAYDRPGYGESGDGVTARDPCSIASELRSLLSAAKVKPPYVLVGHSLGGLYQYAFAKLYPAEVAGIVLLDPTHPQHWQRMQRDLPVFAALVSGMRATLFSAAMRREFDDQEKCLERLAALPPIDNVTRVLTRSRFELSELGPFESMVRALEPDWLTLTGAKQIERVVGARHYIHKDRPDAVVAAINAVALAPQSVRN